MINRICGARAASRDRGDPEAWTRLADIAAHIDLGEPQHDPEIWEWFALLRNDWTRLLLTALSVGAWRRATLKRIVEALSQVRVAQPTFAAKLRLLERHGLVVRQSGVDGVLGTHYRITEAGAGLLHQMESVASSLSAHRAQIEAAKARFDAEQRTSGKPASAANDARRR